MPAAGSGPECGPAWSPAGEADAKGDYPIGSVNRAVLSGFKIGETYQFFVTAYDNDGRESAMSDPYVVKVQL